jgi:hypothetical protein
VTLERDHVELDAAIARITARLRLLAHQHNKMLRHDNHRRLGDDAAAFNNVLVDHLDREEQIVVPAFESMISTADQRVLSTAEFMLATYRHVRMAVPLVLANATPDQAANCCKRSRVDHGYACDVAPAQTDGRRSAHGSSSSSWAATRMRRSSLSDAALIKTPMGSPLEDMPSGRLMDGWPVKLN